MSEWPNPPNPPGPIKKNPEPVPAVSNHLTYSKQGLELTKKFEGCRLTAYQDARGVWTIGYGHTGPEVHEGMTITQEEADTLLANDIKWASEVVNRMVTGYPLLQQEFDALVDFVFNVGAKAFAESTMLAELNQGNPVGAANEFEKWSHVSGKVVAGLLRRRDAERAEFTSP
jgi:lysozyme